MSHNDSLYLIHMLEVARKVAGKANDTDFERFVADENLHLACVHLVQMIGEAASRVSDETRAHHPAVPWRQIIGMRHRVVHDYLDVDLEIVWQVICGDLPDVIADLERAIASE